MYVRTICEDDQNSAWSELETFTTLTEDIHEDPYCHGDYFEEEGGIESFTTSNGTENIHNNEISDPTGYHDFTDQKISLYMGGSFNFEAHIQDYLGIDDAIVAIYIDYDKNFEFDSSEQVYNSVEWVTTATGSIQIPSDLSPGDYRLRVVSDWLDLLGPCEAAGSIHDYTLTILSGSPIDECEAPIEVLIGEVTDTTAEISWTPQGEETSWLVVYGEAGDDLEDFLQAVVLEPMYTLENLDPETDYEVYVMAICDEEEDIYSDASETVTFQTGPLSVDNQIFEDFSFYPNPVENILNLQANAQIEKVEVYNLIGQKVISIQPQLLETQIHTQALQSGVYLMKVTIDGAEKTFRVIKK